MSARERLIYSRPDVERLVLLRSMRGQVVTVVHDPLRSGHDTNTYIGVLVAAGTLRVGSFSTCVVLRLADGTDVFLSSATIRSCELGA